ncbi:c-type cytochrome [Aurantimonas marina]|uniref:c-type cytochrome n=1 Tax=Aurantimonas marina TaxID=2780508 RepID=UPI001E47AA16|nr:c-type cytochrome [Aurantimonas marina]
MTIIFYLAQAFEAHDVRSVGSTIYPQGHPGVRWRVKAVGAAILVLSFAQSGPLSAAGAAGSDIAANGTAGGAPACASCHGQSGEGQPEGPFPRLAGINATYLASQLQDFADGKRQSDIMGSIAQSLTEEEMVAVAKYYAEKLTPKANEPTPLDPAAVSAGEKLAMRGDWSRGLPGCSQCHGPGGAGVGATFPKLSGQSMEYTAGQLRAWQDKQRTNDPLGLMAGVASKLDDAEIQAVASYYASLPVEQAPPSQSSGGKQ